MPEEPIQVGVGLEADIENLEEELEDGDFSTTVDVEGEEGGGGGGLLAGAFGAEAGSDVATGGGRGAGLLGGISRIVLLLGAAVGFLATLEPIQKLFSSIQRIFSLLLAPVLVALRPLMEGLLRMTMKLLDFFGVIDTNQNQSSQQLGRIGQSFIPGAFQPLATAVGGGMSQSTQNQQSQGGGGGGFFDFIPNWIMNADLSPEAQKENANRDSTAGSRQTTGGGNGGGAWWEFW